MEDKTSEQFQSTAKNITSVMDESFQPTLSYTGSVVLALRRIQNDGSRTESGISAEVEILFSATSDVTAEDVIQTVKNNVTCDDCALKGIFESKDLCESKPCDEKSSTCVGGGGGFVCSCLEGHIKTSLTDRMCIACANSKKFNETHCAPCPPHYSGFNCEDDSEFLLIIIAPILGGLLLITVIVLIVKSCKSKKSSKRSKNEDVVKPYVSHSPAKAPLVNGNVSNGATHSINGQANFGASRFPRATATATNGWESRTNLEMTPSNSRQNLIPAGPNSYQTRPQTNPYAQSGPQSSSYGQNRNPYAETRGHSNPYFTSDDGRRLN
ncbi:unnamed protein product [Menidia menidia]|uniref:(Atlantic silverside) hypothetical protein n=1 Tax=Menidia menidia TaxID=238744 RepID=A0A8S4B2W1_9TELE|nr:unnamed protein product [Menidia menidia]